MGRILLDTPVVFLIFNRPDTTARVFAEIARARPRRLFVVADGPRPHVPSDAERCAAARAVVEQVDWECQASTHYAETNLGCGRRVSSGIAWAFAQVEEAIILEDDCLPHPDFFPFCQQLLARYRDDERVMMVAGSNMLVRHDVGESYLFSRYYNIWGWATWRRAWQHYDYAMAGWERLRNTRAVEYCYPVRYVAQYVRKNFDLLRRGEIDTWDIQWFYACMAQNSLAVLPRENLISNIGSAGTHTDRIHDPSLPLGELDTTALVHPREVLANAAYDERFFRQFIRESLPNRAQRYRIAANHRYWRLRKRLGGR